MQQKQQPMMEGGPAIQMPMPQNMLESEMIGAIKIKDGLFIGDELASTVSTHPSQGRMRQYKAKPFF